jgi:hypothetical protein
MALEDDCDFPVNFYHAPIGVDPSVFHTVPAERSFIVASSGNSWMIESVREVMYAAQQTGLPVFHVGEVNFNFGYPVAYSMGRHDGFLAENYSRCRYVAGLRRTEGFEIPAVEGLFCGARPILFDAPHYRKWYDGLALFIPETSRSEVIDNLVEIFNRPYQPVTDDEIMLAHDRFDWKKIATEFWRRCMT